VILSSKF
jgi:hypothetical protein